MWPDDWYERLKGATFEAPPMYCTRCGATLVKVERQEGWTTYGARVVVPGWQCPKGLGLLNRLLLRYMVHSDYRADTFGSRGIWSQVEYR